MVISLSRRRSGFETHALLQFTWGMGLLGDGHRVLSAEKRVRNPYALPTRCLCHGTGAVAVKLGANGAVAVKLDANGAVAQSVERAPHKGVVTGSIPVGATNIERSALLRFKS
jgi:hypothetical protein